MGKRQGTVTERVVCGLIVGTLIGVTSVCIIRMLAYAYLVTKGIG